MKAVDIDAMKASRAARTSPASPWATASAGDGVLRLGGRAGGHAPLSESYADSGPDARVLDPVGIRDAKFAYGLDVVLDGPAMRLPR
ncbi:hypothetical protein ACFYXS_24870 [Streptomyces sp. NPDC002574]|uniref:hypothetical protein n=1 Tax=Streptomyces sp. NPDC002574 TaxID=3364652 RepID=UPI0036BDF51E